MTAHVVLTSIGSYFPKNIITNEFFDELNIGSSDEWVRSRTGIESRHSVLSHSDLKDLREGSTTLSRLRSEGKVEPISHMAEQAWQHMLSTRDQDTPSPDCVICGTSVPDFDIPANASTIAAKIGLSSTSFDVNSACSSFITNLATAKALHDNSSFDSTAVFNVERYTTRLNYEDKTSCILFGDAATCSILESDPGKPGLELIDVIVRSDPSGYQQVTIPSSGLFSQDGKAVQKFAISKSCEAAETLMKKHGLTPKDIRFFVGHQANLRMLRSTVQKLGFSEEQHLYNVHKRGNQGAASVPAVLSEHWGEFEPGDYVLISAVGSGLTWGSALFRWQSH